MTEWIWPTLQQWRTLFIEYDQNWNWQTLTLCEGSPNLRFWSNRASKAPQWSQPVWACKPGLGDLSKLTAPACSWSELNVCRCHKNNKFCGHFQKLSFVIVVIFRSYSKQFLVIFIRSCALASVQVESSHNFLMDFDVWFHLGPVVLCLSDLVVSHCVDFCIVVGPVQPVGQGGSVVSPWRVWRHKFDSFSEFNVSL